MSEWFTDESLWQDLYLFLFPEERFQQAEEEIGKIIKLLDFKGKRVLDLACGPGRHSIALAKKGLQVTGVDRSLLLLKKAKEFSAKENVDVEWIHEDMRNFIRNEYFDLLINLFTSFGYFDNRNEDLIQLKNMYSSLKSGGYCVIDVVGKEWLAKHFEPTHATDLADGSILIERREIIDNWSRIQNEWILIKNKMAKSFAFTLNIYSGQELKNLLQKAGFKKVQLYGDLDGSEYGSEAKRLLALAQK
jgi:SAM-dependent methyltransferase